MSVIGTCSICGGAVTTPDVWAGVIPPIPQCSRCRAVAAEAHGPVIPMLKPGHPVRQPAPGLVRRLF